VHHATLSVQVRFKVRTITFTALTKSVKGTMATSTSETQDKAGGSGANSNGGASAPPPTLRRRSSSMGLAPDDEIPAVMQITGAMNDFGLGLISWW
jgi:hypothetical protein